MGFTNAEAKDSLPVMQAVGKTQPCFGGQRSTTADVKTTWLKMSIFSNHIDRYMKNMFVYLYTKIFSISEKFNYIYVDSLSLNVCVYKIYTYIFCVYINI